MILEKTTRPSIGILGLAAAMSLAFAGVAGASMAPTPITATGWNQDSILSPNANSTGPAAVTTAGTVSFGNGYNGSSTLFFGSGFANDTKGLPTADTGTNTFVSAATNTVTGGNTTFQLQDTLVTGSSSAGYVGTNNVLYLYNSTTGLGAPGTLTLSTPTAYSSLAILATSANASSTTSGTFVVNFANGTSSSAFTFSAPDWGNGTGIASEAVPNGFDRYDSGASPTTGGHTFGLYETDVALSGVEATTPITGITFNSGGAQTGVFAISGVASPVPEPAVLPLMGIAGFGLLILKRRFARA